MANTRLSVLMAFYKTPLFLVEDALDSLRHQSSSDFELVLIDDASESQKLPELERLLSEQPFQTKYVRCSSNQGPAFARNLGASVAEGDYLAVLDSDDRFEKKTVEAFIERIELDHPDYLFSNHRKFDFDMEQIIQVRDKAQLFELHKEHKGSVYDPLLYFKFSGAAECFARDAFDDVGGYSQGLLAEDWDLVDKVSLLRDSVNFAHVPHMAYQYRHVPTSISHSKSASRFIEVANLILGRHKITYDSRFEYASKLLPQGNTFYGIIQNGREVNIPYVQTSRDGKHYLLESDFGAQANSSTHFA